MNDQYIISDFAFCVNQEGNVGLPKQEQSVIKRPVRTSLTTLGGVLAMEGKAVFAMLVLLFFLVMIAMIILYLVFDSKAFTAKEKGNSDLSRKMSRVAGTILVTGYTSLVVIAIVLSSVMRHMVR